VDVLVISETGKLAIKEELRVYFWIMA